MAKPADKLADTLTALKKLQDAGVIAIPTSALSRLHRERLVAQGFIREVMKGWYIPAQPDGLPDESTAWYASFWPFCASYLTERFGTEWCLSPEQSIALHTANWTVPRQLMVRTPSGDNKPTALLHETSIFNIRLALPPEADVTVLDGLRIMRLPVALVHCTPTQFAAHPLDVRAALAMITDASDILTPLLDGGHTFVAGRLAGAFRSIGRTRIADTIADTMKAAGLPITETNPFDGQPPVTFALRATEPAVNRQRMMWEQMRADILAHAPRAPGLPQDAQAYLHSVEDTYATDAYNSLSIEGYRVSAALIERVRSGDWDPDSEADRDRRNALAARGYWQAFQKVKDGVRTVLEGANAGDVAADDHAAWYREFFAPSVAAGLLRAADLAGYRSSPVYIRHSKHVPPRRESVRNLMPAFFDELRHETEPFVRVVLGHFVFVYIHPYMDGNGRIGRFMMNLMLASGGYPWTVIPLTARERYMQALEAASAAQDIRPFADLLAELVERR